MIHPYPMIYNKTYDGRIIELTRPYLVTVDIQGHTYTIVAPMGFVSDYASVPRFLWRIVPPFGIYAPATVIHDFIYSNKTFPRLVCDKIFLEMMVKLEVKRWRRNAMFQGVNQFGKKHYGKKFV